MLEQAMTDRNAIKLAEEIATGEKAPTPATLTESGLAD
jgi:hypothetical protein